MKRLKKWYARCFKVITKQQVEEWELTHVRNVYGDEVNHIHCRSIWKDLKGRTYRAAFLLLDKTEIDTIKLGSKKTMLLLDKKSAIKAKVNTMTTILNLSKRYDVYYSVNLNTSIMKLNHPQSPWYEERILPRVEVFRQN